MTAKDYVIYCSDTRSYYKAGSPFGSKVLYFTEKVNDALPFRNKEYAREIISALLKISPSARLQILRREDI